MLPPTFCMDDGGSMWGKVEGVFFAYQTLLE